LCKGEKATNWRAVPTELKEATTLNEIDINGVHVHNKKVELACNEPDIFKKLDLLPSA